MVKANRRLLNARVAALESARIGRWEFQLDDGTTIQVPILAVLQVFGVGLSVVHGDEEPEEPSKYLALLGRAVSTPDDSMLAQSVVAVARAAREKRTADDR
jgi:hypothetical protein